MPTFYHLINHIKSSDNRHKPLYLFSLLLFFFVIFDGIVSYTVPLLIVEAGISDTVMGLIVASSSVAGAIFDLLLCRFLKNTNFRRLLMMMFGMALFFPLVLTQSKTAFGFTVAMVLWGLYYDFFNLSQFDFVAREMGKNEHTSSYGIISVFKSLGYAVAPLLAGLLVGVAVVGSKPIILASVFFLISVMFFVILWKNRNREKKVETLLPPSCPNIPRAGSLYREISLWWRLGRVIFPVLFLIFLLNVIDVFFWTIGPLFSENFGIWGSLFLFSYQLPPLLVGWFVGGVAKRFGKKRTAIVSFLIGSLIYCTFWFISNIWLIIGLNFLAAFFLSFSWPAISGACADYESESPSLAREIETIQDYFTNLGCVIGPIFAGILSDNLGHVNTFSALGVFGVVSAVWLLIVTPKKISIAKVSLDT